MSDGGGGDGDDYGAGEERNPDEVEGSFALLQAYSKLEGRCYDPFGLHPELSGPSSMCDAGGHASGGPCPCSSRRIS